MNRSTVNSMTLRMPVAGTQQRLVGLNLGLTLFHPIPFKAHAPQVLQLLEGYLRMVPLSTFKWQNLSGTEKGYKAISKTAMPTIVGWLQGKKSYGSSCAIWLKDGDAITDVGDNLFDSYGRDAADDDGDSNYLQILFPWNVLESVPPAEFLANVRALIAPLPFHSGYLGYTLGVSTLFNDAGYEEDIEAKVYGAVRRFRGVETFQPHLENYEMASKMRPPSWVTFVSNHFVQTLGGLDALRKKLGKGELGIDTLAHGVAIRAGALPVLADGNRSEDVTPEQKLLARVLSPLYSDQPAYLFTNYPHEDTVAWLRRHLA